MRHSGLLSALLASSMLIAPACFFLTQSGGCGDGILDEPQSEACDDANTDPGDGCTADCLAIEPGFECPNPGQACVANPICGNGIEEPGETCDDGNNSNNDDCPDGNGGTCQDAFCGDGFILSGVEGCDPPDANGCSAQCQLNCVLPEDCDDGDACTAEACTNNNCVLTAVDVDDNDVCTDDSCDSIAGPQHDPIDVDDNDDCTDDSCDPLAGPQHDPVSEGTTCDADQNGATRDLCLTVGGSFACRPSQCGDGFLDATNNEQCDDGNGVDNDACDNQCQNNVDVDCNADQNALANAINNAASGDTIVAIGNCQFGSTATLNNKNLTIIGVEGSTTITGTSTNLILDVSGNSTVILQDIKITTTSLNNLLVRVIANGKLALINSELSNFTAGSTTLDCSGSGGRVLIDRSKLTGNDGSEVLHFSGGCLAVIANSLFVGNDVVKNIVVDDPSDVNVVFSTFFDSPGFNGGLIECNNNGSTCRLDSVVSSNLGSNPVQASASASISLTASFVFGETVSGNTNIDPQINATNFHIQNAAALGKATANPPAAGFALFFDPVSLFGVDVFTHDKNNRSRPVGARDSGAFEEN